MFYDVLVNYYSWSGNNWKKLSKVRNFNRVKYLYKKEINSRNSFVYVRKILEDKQSKPVVTNFKIISCFSYTFAHFPKLPDDVNNSLVNIFDNLEDSYGEVINEN